MAGHEADERLEAQRRRWQEETVAPAVERFPERQSPFRNHSGRTVERLYTPSESELDYLRDLGFPGEFPFTRGPYPTMYRGRLWTLREYAGYGDAEAANARFRYLLEQGQRGLSVAFDLPTQMGYDSDHSLAHGEVGKVGVSIDTVDDMERLFDGIDLGQVSTSMTINAPAAILLAMYVVVARRQGVAASQLRGTVQNDILKEYVARGTYIFPPRPSMRLVTDTIAYCAGELPNWNTVSVSGYHIREAGSTAAQEVAFTLANAVAYVEAALAAGLDVDAFAPRLSFFFNAHLDLFEEVAKFRAARRLWARIMRQRFAAQKKRSQLLRFHAQTAGSTLTAQQPDNNVVRVAVQALAAILGGVQSLHTNARDEALGLPTEEAARLAVRTQQILAEETGVAQTVDPLAGSYYVEHLTGAIEGEAREYLEAIDELGGAVAAIESGFMQREIQQAAYEYQQRIERDELTVVGVNRYQEDEEEPIAVQRPDAEAVARQQRRLEAVRRERDGAAVRQALDALAAAAAGDQALFPRILAAVEVRATIGEIAGSLREVFGEHEPAQLW